MEITFLKILWIFFTILWKLFLGYRRIKKRLENHNQTALAGNTKGGSITVPLTSCLTGLEYSVLQLKAKIVSCHTADSKPVKQEVNGTLILPSLVFLC